MIKEHEFNTEWWGAPVAVVSDPEFFRISRGERDALLAPYAWGEFKAPCTPGRTASTRFNRCGFFLVDIQIEFRIALEQVPASPSLDRLEVRFADESPFVVGTGESMVFQQERFALLPGITPEKLDQRYLDWANRTVAEEPEWCLQVLRDGIVEGWLISRMAGGALHLTLGMLRSGARITGMHLYHKAMLAYAARGARLGGAEFSATNISVLNIYSALGARFSGSRDCWLWIPEEPYGA